MLLDTNHSRGLMTDRYVPKKQQYGVRKSLHNMYALSWDEILVVRWRSTSKFSLIHIFMRFIFRAIIEKPDPFKIYVASTHCMVAKYSRKFDIKCKGGGIVTDSKSLSISRVS